MTITELLEVFDVKTDVRVNVINGGTYNGSAGTHNRDSILRGLLHDKCDNAMVIRVQPLYHARMVYVDCMKW